MNENPSVASPAPAQDNLKPLLNYLPIVVIFVILLVGFLTSGVIKGKLSVFVTLLVSIVFVFFIHHFNPNKYVTLNSDNTAILIPDPPSNTFDMSMWYILIAVVVGIIGIGLGFGSTDISRKGESGSYDPSNILMGFGGTFIVIIGFFLVISACKLFGVDSEWIKNFSPKMLVLGVITCVVIGIPMLVNGVKMRDQKETIPAESKGDFAKELATNGANVALSIGLILQIVIFAFFAYLAWRNSSGESATTVKISLGITVAILVIIGAIFISKSQRGPGFDGANSAEIGSFENKTFLVHGIIYLIVGVLFLALLFRKNPMLTVYKGFFAALILGILSLTGWSLAEMTAESEIPTADSILKKDQSNNQKYANAYMDSGYYQQLRAEVIKDMKQKSPNADFSDDSEDVKAEMDRRLDEIRKKTESPSKIVLILFSILSIIIVLFIHVSYNARLMLANCKALPKGWSWLKDVFFHVFKGDCDDIAAKSVKVDDIAKNTPPYSQKIKEDNMFSSDWESILSKHDPNTDNFNPTFVRFAKMFSYIPFLSVVLLLLWLSVLFTNVTTSTDTSDWIASNFSGDMFPRVKELIDTFFIVLIVGLLLCGFLLFPAVKEMNIGGLDNILQFAESIQVWQFKKNEPSSASQFLAIAGFVIVAVVGLSWWWKYLNETRKGDTSLPVVPQNGGWAIAFVIILAICSMPAFYNFYGTGVHPDFANEGVITRAIRLILTTVYLVPWFFVTIFKIIIYGLGSLTGSQAFAEKRDEEIAKLNFWNWSAGETDLRMFPTSDTVIQPKDVTSISSSSSAAPSASEDTAGATAAASTAAATTGISETKVSALGKLIKVVLLIVSFVILILMVVYFVYKIDGTNRLSKAESTSDGGFVNKLNSPTAQTIYVIMAIVGIAGLVAYLREKFTKTNSKTPEDYLFEDTKPEDSNSPMRQLTFGMTHIIYIILMIVVWIYDKDKDGNPMMSGMTALALAILFFHYFLEFIDNKRAPKQGESESNTKDTTPGMAPLSNLLTNIRFIVNTIFLVAIAALSHYKRHEVMVVVIIFMFLFHLTKSILGIKLLKLLWSFIIYIPCLFLGLITSMQGTVGDTTRPMWIIVAIELILVAILIGGPFLVNYIGASASQIVSAPVSLKQKHDTNLDTQSPSIFIFHNTGKDRTPEDAAANCPVEEKKRYNYAISGWFFLNNNVTTKNEDLEIFNFGDVPTMTYNASKNEFKLKCKVLDMATGRSKEGIAEIYNSRKNYNQLTNANTEDKQTKLKILNEDTKLDADIPLQKWNYFVINYDGKTMDLFLNNNLIFKSEFIMPDIQMKMITVGDTTDNKGLNGSICNFSFHKKPLTKEQIRWTYTMLKSRNPPMIGMKTIQDEGNITSGSSTVYSQ